MNSAIFLDRDGVVNFSIIREKKPYAPLYLSELEIIPEIKTVIDFFKQRQFKVFVITNQPDVARGKVTIDEVEKINEFIQSQLSIDEIFTCYHDDQDQCECRKPKSGAFMALSKKYNIDLTESIMVGDRAKDIEAARNAIFSELTEVIEFDSTYINYHHLSMLCDRMCYKSKMISIFRTLQVIK